MEKLTIKQASERFGLSRARLYQLLDKGAVAGFRSNKLGKAGGTWIHAGDLAKHLETTKGNAIRPNVYGDDIYISVAEACKISGYSQAQMYRFAKQKTLLSKKEQRNGILINKIDLLNYLKNK